MPEYLNTPLRLNTAKEKKQKKMKGRTREKEIMSTPWN